MKLMNKTPKEKLEVGLHFRCSKAIYSKLAKLTSVKSNYKISDVIRDSIKFYLSYGKQKT